MAFGQKIIFNGSSENGKYKVVDMQYVGRDARVLYGGGRSPQSGVALDDDPELLFEYNQRFMEMIISKRPKKILVIGGGVFMLPTAVINRFPDIAVDVVEIDGLLVDLARKYFDLPQTSRLKIFIEDGKTYLENTPQQYDMIIVDAFSGFTIPHHLLERSAAVLYKKHLRKNGVVAINFISEFIGPRHRLTHDIVYTFSEVFAFQDLYQADSDYPKKEDQNLLFIAGRDTVEFDYLQSVSVIDLVHAPSS